MERYTPSLPHGVLRRWCDCSYLTMLDVYFRRSLAEACSDGDIGTVRRLLDEGGSVHETTEEGETLLSLACSAGYYELAQVTFAIREHVYLSYFHYGILKHVILIFSFVLFLFFLIKNMTDVIVWLL